MRLTNAQRRLLKIIDDFAEPGEGWGEVQLQFIDRSPCLPRNLEGSSFKRVLDALVRKGLIAAQTNGPVLTPKGEEIMQDQGRIRWLDSGDVDKLRGALV